MNKQENYSRRQMLEVAIGLGSIAMTGGVGAVLAQQKKRDTPTTKALDE